MAATLNNDQTQLPNLAQMLGGQVNTTTNSGSAVGGSGTSGGTSNSSSGGPTASPQADVANITNLNQGFDFSPLLSYVGQQGTAARGAINTANQNFNTQLGTFNPFGTDAQNTLSAAIKGTQPISAGSALLNQSYKGPAGVDRTTYDPLVQQYVTSANETSNANGIGTLLGTLRPDLTPGERNYDALVFGQNPTYQTDSRNLVNDANDVQALGDTTYNNGATAVTNRQNDINAFNTAAKGYVQQQIDAINGALNNQINQAGQADQGVNTLMGQIANGQAALSSVPSNELAFNPALYPAQTFTGQYDTSFNQTVDPTQYLTFQPGALATRNNVATPDEVTQYNNAENLLGGYDTLTPSARQGAEIGFNQIAFQQALANAIAARNAADAAWQAAHQPAPAATAATTAAATPSGPEGSDVADSAGQAAAAAEADPAGTSDVGAAASGSTGDMSSSGDTSGGDSGGGSAGGGGDTAGGADSSDGAAGAGGGSGETGPGGGAFAKGGLIRSQGGKQHQIAGPARPMAGQQGLAQLLAGARAPITMQRGGYLPPGTGTPGVTDSIPARVNDGEFVTKAPSTKAVGVQNMQRLNQVNQLPPQGQHMVRHALHTALTRAQGKGFSQGGLTTAQRNDMPTDEFAGPGRSFPVNDPKHARLAISGATRSFNAGNISKGQEDAIKSKARNKLGA